MSLFDRIGVGALAASACLAIAGAAGAAPAPTQPKLVVAISVDQFSANLYEAWRPRFTGGFKRLSDGLVYPSGYQSHANTETCPGHSTLLTGKHPNKTGIVGNDVRDPATGKMVYCLNDTSVVRADGDTSMSVVGPQQLLAETLGDWLKTTSPQSKVVAVSGKDRGAINMAGHKADGTFWYKAGFGFTTYMTPGGDAQAALAPIAPVNAALAPMWKQRPKWTVSPACKAAEFNIEVAGKPYSATVPPAGYGESDEAAAIARQIQYSPNFDRITLQAAEGLIDYYKLGRGPATDVLAVSFSGTDYVGHLYGSRGPEMCSQMTSLDGLIGQLLVDLDKLGVPYVVVLSADHGGSDMAERLAQQGYPSQRVDQRPAFAALNAALQAEFNLAAPPATGSLEEVYLTIADPILRKQVAASAKRRLLTLPEIAAAFTVDELLATPIPRSAGKDGKPADELSIQERFAESTYLGRSPDVSAALQPYYQSRYAGPGANLGGHGSVWNYDRRVPILFWWKGAPSQTRFLPIETVDIAPTLAALVGVTPPADIDGRCLPLAEVGPGACTR
jgi:predicted AlkP superfamily pyrophosphatase or phosphodiesterase